MNKKQLLQKKIELIHHDTIYVKKNQPILKNISRSTAGPDAGKKTITLDFNNHRIKLLISTNPNEEFILKEGKKNYSILKKNKKFLQNVQIIPVYFHAPQQAFLNISDQCIYNCAFCTLQPKSRLTKINDHKFITIINKSIESKKVKAVALTSGIYPNNTLIINRMMGITQAIKQHHPNVPIGVEPCIFKKQEIINLKKAGADELKLNLQTPNEQIFNCICPGFNHKKIKSLLKEAVTIFGENKVTSNILYGLGETNEQIISCMHDLALHGIAPNLRKIRISKFNKYKLKNALPSPLPQLSFKRTLYLAKKQKEIMQQNNLTTQTWMTMCFACGCCDIIPFWDL